MNHILGLAAAFKIDLTSVIFASAASAASFPATGGAKKFVIAGSDKFGQKTDDLLPDYGMYLRTKADDGVEFTPDKLTFDGANLTVSYSGGEADHYVVVHAFKEDSLSDGHTSYVAAQKLVESGTSATINVSAWGISSLDDLTVKVWMEDSSGSLAKATMPVTFVGTTQTETGACKNARVFAMKEDLQCSWGDLSALSEDNFKKVIAGENADATRGVMGTNPTNQKLYLGTANGEPIEFWIAGREDKANDGIIKSDGDIMTLYQATSVENTKFNASTSNYDVPEKPAVTLQLADEQSVEYTGSAVNYPAGKITFKQDTKDLGENTLKWQHREPGTTTWETGMPTKIGSYEIRCYAEGTDNYEQTSSAVVNFTITKADPTYTQNPIKITAKYGQTLTDAGWNSTLVAPKDVNGKDLSGEWGLKDNKNNTVELSTQLNSTGTFNYKAIFILNGSNPNYNTVQIDCTVVVEANTENWGNVEQLPNGKIQYVDNDGTTGIEVSSSNLDENGILWLKEDSDGSSAWYGLKIGDAFDLDKGYRFSVRWLSPKDADYDTYYSQLDDATRAEVDSNRGWTFLVEVKDQSGELIQPQLNKTVNLYVQIGDDWDKEDLQAYYITQGKDESVQVQYGTTTYPEGTDEFGVMTLQHFSPYFIYDKLTDEEKAQLDDTAEELATQQGRTTEVNEISNNESTKTGDEITYFTISGLGFIMTLAFGLMTISKINRKKFNK